MKMEVFEVCNSEGETKPNSTSLRLLFPALPLQARPACSSLSSAPLSVLPSAPQLPASGNPSKLPAPFPSSGASGLSCVRVGAGVTSPETAHCKIHSPKHLNQNTGERVHGPEVQVGVGFIFVRIWGSPPFRPSFCTPAAHPALTLHLCCMRQQGLGLHRPSLA